MRTAIILQKQKQKKQKNKKNTKTIMKPRQIQYSKLSWFFVYICPNDFTEKKQNKKKHCIHFGLSFLSLYN